MEREIATSRETLEPKRRFDKRCFGALATLCIAASSLAGCSNPEPEHYLISLEASCIGPNGESNSSVPIQLKEVQDRDGKNTIRGESYPDSLIFACPEGMEPSITRYGVTKYEANNTDETSTGNGWGIVITGEAGKRSALGVFDTQDESGNPTGLEVRFNATSRVESITIPKPDANTQP